MKLESDEVIKGRIASGVQLSTIALTSRVPYSHLLRLRSEVESDTLLKSPHMSKAGVGELVKDIAKEKHLDESMHSLAGAIVVRLEGMMADSRSPQDLSSTVESLALLRLAFYGKPALPAGGGGGKGGGSRDDALGQFTRRLGR